MVPSFCLHHRRFFLYVYLICVSYAQIINILEYPKLNKMLNKKSELICSVDIYKKFLSSH